jgi:hypothetical protein
VKDQYMNKAGHFSALVGLLGAAPVQAASDMGLTLHNSGMGQRAMGVGAKVGVRIGLGPDRVVKKSERLKLGISAGPAMVMPNSASAIGMKRDQASFIGLEMRPGYSASFNLAGRPVMSGYTKLGAAEKDKESEEGDKQSTGSKIGWVALVAGGVMVALVGTYLLACGPGEDNSCGSD